MQITYTVNCRLFFWYLNERWFSCVNKLAIHLLLSIPILYFKNRALVRVDSHIMHIYSTLWVPQQKCPVGLKPGSVRFLDTCQRIESKSNGQFSSKELSIFTLKKFEFSQSFPVYLKSLTSGSLIKGCSKQFSLQRWETTNIFVWGVGVYIHIFTTICLGVGCSTAGICTTGILLYFMYEGLGSPKNTASHPIP